MAQQMKMQVQGAGGIIAERLHTGAAHQDQAEDNYLCPVCLAVVHTRRHHCLSLRRH